MSRSLSHYEHVLRPQDRTDSDEHVLVYQITWEQDRAGLLHSDGSRLMRQRHRATCTCGWSQFGTSGVVEQADEAWLRHLADCQSCDTCRFYDTAGPSSLNGQCRRYPDYVPVHRVDWCGEWQVLTAVGVPQRREKDDGE